MSPLVRDLLVNGLMAGAAVRTTRKKTTGIGYYAAAGFAATLGMIYAVWAGYAYLALSLSAPVAAGFVAGMLFVLSAGIGLAGFLVARNKQEAMKKPSFDGNFIGEMEARVKSLIDELEDPIRDNPKSALLMAALAGFAAGDKFGDKVH